MILQRIIAAAAFKLAGRCIKINLDNLDRSIKFLRCGALIFHNVRVDLFGLDSVEDCLRL